MSNFTVTRIIDGDTFDVTPQWKWNGQTGSRHGTEIQEHAFGQQVMMPLNLMLTVVKPPRTNFQISFLAKRLICAPRTRSTGNTNKGRSYDGTQ